MKLYEEPEKPKDALSFFTGSMGQPNQAEILHKTAKQEKEELKAEVCYSKYLLHLILNEPRLSSSSPPKPRSPN